MTFQYSTVQLSSGLLAGLLAAASLVTAQTQAPSGPAPYPDSSNGTQMQSTADGSWTPVGNGAPTYSSQPSQAPQTPVPTGQSQYPQAPYGQGSATYGQQPYPDRQQPYQTAGSPAPQAMPPTQPVPARLNIAAGTFITVRVNQTLSSDHNQPGDGFSAVLVAPLVVNGVVVAEPGQTIAGQVVEAQKAGRVEGTARLGITLTELTLVDGQQLPLHTQLVNRSGATSVGRDAGAIATTTGVGAALGAAAGWGTGAAIGAGAGALAGTVGVLLTRGHASVIYPEQVLTFRIDSPLTIDTTRATQAFRYVQPNEYDRPVYNQSTPTPYAAVPRAPVAVAAAPYYGYGYGYPYYSPYYWGPGFSVLIGGGPRYYGRPSFYGGPRFYGGRGSFRR